MAAADVLHKPSLPSVFIRPNRFSCPSLTDAKFCRPSSKPLLPLYGQDLTYSVQILVEDATRAIEQGLLPVLCKSGSGGTYFMPSSSHEEIAAVFKPMDEEPLARNCPKGVSSYPVREGLKRGTVVEEGAYREVAAYVLDHPFRGVKSTGSGEGFSSVPPTVMAVCNARGFATGLLDGVAAVKVGSLQKFVPAYSDCEEMGPSKFPVEEVHKIAILDIRLANADRNGANILVCPSGDSYKLVPIDHGYCLPENLEDCTFEWLFWPQAKQPFSGKSLAYIHQLDAEKDLDLLNRHGWKVNDKVSRTLRIGTMLLKKGVAAGLTPYDIGKMMVRGKCDEPSKVEEMVLIAESRCAKNQDLAFMKHFEEVVDDALGL